MEIDNLLVFHCAPTLAKLKMAALICVPFSDEESFNQMVDEYNTRYNDRGLYFKMIGTCKSRNLLYIYRASRVAAYIREPGTRAFLETYGYEASMTLKEALNRLESRFSTMEDFPHELGIFLGYPLEDVKAFIVYGGQHAKLCGEWKVYTDVHYAQREFSKYEACRKCYVDMFNRGFTVDRLIIA